MSSAYYCLVLVMLLVLHPLSIVMPIPRVGEEWQAPLISPHAYTGCMLTGAFNQIYQIYIQIFDICVRVWEVPLRCFQGELGLNVAQMVVELIRDNRKIVDRITHGQIDEFVDLLRQNKVNCLHCTTVVVHLFAVIIQITKVVHIHSYHYEQKHMRTNRNEKYLHPIYS